MAATISPGDELPMPPRTDQNASDPNRKVAPEVDQTWVADRSLALRTAKAPRALPNLRDSYAVPSDDEDPLQSVEVN
jgi:hypothetical protein